METNGRCENLKCFGEWIWEQFKTGIKGAFIILIVYFSYISISGFFWGETEELNFSKHPYIANTKDVYTITPGHNLVTHEGVYSIERLRLNNRKDFSNITEKVYEQATQISRDLGFTKDDKVHFEETEHGQYVLLTPKKEQLGILYDTDLKEIVGVVKHGFTEKELYELKKMGYAGKYYNLDDKVVVSSRTLVTEKG